MRFDTVDSPGRVLPFCGSTPSLTSSTSALTNCKASASREAARRCEHQTDGGAGAAGAPSEVSLLAGRDSNPAASAPSRRPRDLYFNLVVADRVGASGPVADGILSVQLAADLINGLFNRAVAEGGQVRSSCRGGSDF